jgi:hypothetical protein
MADLIVAADFGASLGRAIYGLNAPYLKPELMLIEPQVVRVPEKSIENYEKYKMSDASPEDSAWVCVDGAYYAVGFLASRAFHAVHCLESLKVDSAIPQALALVGSAAQRKGLPQQFSLSLGILLPWSEFRDREKFHSQIAQALADYTFRGKPMSVELESFVALPEGGGIFARGRVPKRGEERLPNPKEVTIAVIMLGYRNSSILLVEKGELTRGVTGELGFAKMVQRIQAFTSGQKADVLISAICQVKRLDEKSLERLAARLARSQEPLLREREKREIAQAIVDAREEYVQLLKNWLSQNLLSQVSVDEFLVSGGTAHYFQREITEMLGHFGGYINWCDSLERRIAKTFGESNGTLRERPKSDRIAKDSLQSRLADTYGLFYSDLAPKKVDVRKND